MINVYCVSNVDDFKKFSWPTKFVGVPRVGEFVRAINSRKIGKVCMITYFETGSGIPAIEVELTKWGVS